MGSKPENQEQDEVPPCPQVKTGTEVPQNDKAEGVNGTATSSTDPSSTEDDDGKSESRTVAQAPPPTAPAEGQQIPSTTAAPSPSHAAPPGDPGTSSTSTTTTTPTPTATHHVPFTPAPSTPAASQESAAGTPATSTPAPPQVPIQPFSYPPYPYYPPMPGYVPPPSAMSTHQPDHTMTGASNPYQYTDVSTLSDPIPDTRRNRGGVTEPFPEKLHRMLEAAEREGTTDIVSFFSHGRAFAIHKPRRFVTEIMPRFFRQTRLTSFQRQLNLYGFRRISQGPDNGGYYHELFLKGRPGLCVNMKRTKVKGAAKLKRDPDSEPNFYSYPPIDTRSTAGLAHLSPSTTSPARPAASPPGTAYPGYTYPPYPYPPMPGAAPYTAAQQSSSPPMYSYPPYYGYPWYPPPHPGHGGQPAYSGTPQASPNKTSTDTKELDSSATGGATTTVGGKSPTQPSTTNDLGGGSSNSAELTLGDKGAVKV